jgi:hypothetical protein
MAVRNVPCTFIHLFDESPEASMPDALSPLKYDILDNKEAPCKVLDSIRPGQGLLISRAWQP